MEGTGTRWLVTLCLLTAAQCVPSRIQPQSETDSEDSRRVLGSSVVTSVSVIMDHGNGTKTYFADGQSKNVHKPTDTAIGSPGNLLSPDRYEFYTFDETGDLVKRLMTLEEIHGLIAGADPESVIADSSPTYYHDALSSHSSEALMHLPASDLESLDAPAVHRVLESVQNVLKNEMAANSGKPAPSMPSGSLHRPDSASAWSALFPGLIETPDDVAHLSGYLLPSKTAEPTAFSSASSSAFSSTAFSSSTSSSSTSPSSTSSSFTSPSSTSSSSTSPSFSTSTSFSKVPFASVRPPPSITVKSPQSSSSSSVKTQSVSTTTEKVRSTPKYTTTARPETPTTKSATTQPTSFKPPSTKKPFRPVQSFDKPKPSLEKPTFTLHPTAKPAAMSDSLEINKEMSASISDMLSQVTDNQSPNNKPLQTNALVEKDNTADYVPEESSPELSYYSPMAMALSTGGALRPVTEALVSAKKPSMTSAFKTTTTQTPYSQKTTSTFTSTRFGPTKYNATKPRPTTNFTTASYVTKPSSYSKYNGTTAASTTRNNYQYPPSNMSTKYMQKITQTTQAYPNKLIDTFVKVVNKTMNNATLSVKQPPEAFWNSTGEIKNKFNKDPNKVFQNKVTSVRPNGINRTNVTLSNRIQELMTTAMPNFSSGFPSTTVRSQTEPDKFVSVKVEEWPMTAHHLTVSPSTTPYVSTEKSFFSGSNQPFSAITDPNAIRELISSLMTKPTTPFSAPTSTASPTTISSTPTLAATVPTSSPTPLKTVTGIPASVISSTTEGTTTTASTTASSSTPAVTTTTPTTPTTTTTTPTPEPQTTTTQTQTLGTLAMMKTGVETAAVVGAAATAAAGAAASTATAETSSTTSVAATTSGSTTTTGSTAASSTTTKTTPAASTTMPSTTPEPETQYVPVTHFLPELQVKDQLESDNNSSSSPGVDSMLKDGISAVANMLQNTQKPSVLDPEFQEMSERPYERVTAAEAKQQTSTEQARKQATVKSDVEGTTTLTENAMTQELFEFTTTTEPVTKLPEPNDTVAMESATVNNTEEISRNSDPGLEMLTVFNVSSTGGPIQAAKLVTDPSTETLNVFDATTPFDNRVVTTTDPAVTTEEPATASTFAPTTTVTARTTTTTTTALPPTTPPPTTTTTTTTTTTSSTAATTTTGAPTTPAEFQNTPSHASFTNNHYNATGALFSNNGSAAPAPGTRSPGPSPNAYRPSANSASPSTVELHPAPHESMGLEASIAFLGDDVRRFADLCNELSFKMWTAVTGKGQIASRSLVLSPFELTAMLAMVFLGARGSTSGQMNDVLRLDDMVTFNPHQVLRNITHSITNANNPGVATASFVREIYSHKGNGKILEFYKERVQQYYDGHVEEVDFNTIGDVLRRRTNLLVKRQTLGRVVEYLRGSGLSLTPPFAAFSANVFQTSCENASTDGRDGEMYFVVRPSTRQRRLVPVPAAVWRGGFLAGYEPGLDATAVCLSPDSPVSTILVLPGQQGQVAPGDGLARLEQRLIETSYRRGGWSRILRSLLPRPGLELQVPRFSHRSVLNTTAALQKMGLRDVFSDQKADLRGVNGLYDLYLSDMLQVNTFSTCGEDAIGARHHVETYPASPQRMGRVEMLAERRRRRRRRYAAAGAGDDLPLHSPYSHMPLNLRPRQARLPDVPRLRFDRPFLYLVRHNPTGMIVYLGRFNPRLLP